MSELPKHQTFSNYHHRPQDETLQLHQRNKDFDFFPSSYKSSTKSPFSHSVHLPLFLGGNAAKSPAKHNSETLPDNFSYYHIDQKNNGDRDNRKINQHEYINKIPNVAVLPNATPKSHYISFSTVAGFYNNQPDTTTTPSPLMDAYKHYNKYRSQGGSLQATPAPVYENTEARAGFFSQNYFPTHQAATSSEYTTPRSQTYYPTTTPRIQPDLLSSNYYQSNSKNLNDFHKSPGHYTYNEHSEEITETPRHSYYVSQLTEKSFPSSVEYTTAAPHFQSTVAGTHGPVVGIDFDFDKFIERIRQGHIGQAKPTGTSLIRNTTVLSAVDITTSIPGLSRQTLWPSSLTTGAIVTKSTPRPFLNNFNTNSYEFKVS